MADKATTTTTTTEAPAATYRDVTGTKANPKTAYRALRQEKGYGRVALAAALGITTSALWRLENHTDLNSAEGKAAMKALRALPSVKRPAPAPKAPKAAQATAKEV